MVFALLHQVGSIMFLSDPGCGSYAGRLLLIHPQYFQAEQVPVINETVAG